MENCMVNYPAGTIKVTPPIGEPWTSSPGDLLYSTALFAASHWWHPHYNEWISVDAYGGDWPTFLSVDKFAFRNSACNALQFGVMLDGEPVQKWETADSERGFVDVWARQDNIPKRHRLFGKVEFVQL